MVTGVAEGVAYHANKREPVLSERHLRTAITEYVVHYHTERNHQGLGNELLTPLPASATVFEYPAYLWRCCTALAESKIRLLCWLRYVRP